MSKIKLWENTHFDKIIAVYDDGTEEEIGYINDDGERIYYADYTTAIPPRKFRSEWNQRQYDAYKKRQTDALNNNDSTPSFPDLLQKHSHNVVAGAGNLLAKVQQVQNTSMQNSGRSYRNPLTSILATGMNFDKNLLINNNEDTQTSSNLYNDNKKNTHSTQRHIESYMDFISENAQIMQELESKILKSQEGISKMSNLLMAGFVIDLGMFWNYFYWIPRLGTDIIEGSEVDWMAEQIGIRASELEEMIVEYNVAYQNYQYGLQALKLAFQSETITLDDGTILERTEDDDSTLIQMGFMGVAGLSIHKNRNNAKGTYVLYRIVIDGKVYKYGVADAGRRTASGIPVRLAQQISKLERILEGTGIGVNYKILVVERTTKFLIKKIETDKILKHAEHSGIPIGNRSHIKKYIGLKIGNLSIRAMRILSKFFKL